MSVQFVPKSYWVRLGLSAFIVWNILAITLTNSQFTPVPMMVVDVLTPYARWTRLMQRWSLFSPEPRRYAGTYYFAITFKDGTKTVWQRPLPPNWDYFARHHAYNWQKIDTASNHMEDQRLWPDIAEWVRREVSSPSNPAVTIQLIQRRADIPPPNESGYVQHDAGEFKAADHLIFNYSAESKEFL